jgi:hypothetical protein
MYGFILSMYVAGKIPDTKVREYQTKGLITENEANLIIATPKI